MPNAKAILGALLKFGEAAAVSSIPGAATVDAGIRGAIKGDADPTTSRLDEIVAGILQASMGGMTVSEAVAEKDIFNDPAVAAAFKNVQDAVANFQHVLVARHVASGGTVAPAAPSA